MGSSSSAVLLLRTLPRPIFPTRRSPELGTSQIAAARSITGSHRLMSCRRWLAVRECFLRPIGCKILNVMVKSTARGVLFSIDLTDFVWATM
jgi:hypothetical protein